MAALPDYSYADPNDLVPDLRDFHERVGRALLQVCALSHRIAQTTWQEKVDQNTVVDHPLDAVADLRRIRSATLNAQDDAAPDLVQVGPLAGNIWGWFRYLNVPESETIVRPLDVASTDPGRWVRQRLPIGADCGTHRYLAHVEYLADQMDNHEITVRCRNKTPALFVSLQSDELEEHSQTYAFHRYVATYRLRVMSANFHGGVQARFQSPLDVERQSDPGTQRILGDLRRALVHDNTLQRTLGVEKVSLGGMRPLYERGAERTLIDSIQVRVIGYVNTPNAPCEAVSPWRMWLQLQDAMGASAGPPNQVTDA